VSMVIPVATMPVIRECGCDQDHQAGSDEQR
jgi:hypothetical protein